MGENIDGWPISQLSSDGSFSFLVYLYVLSDHCMSSIQGTLIGEFADAAASIVCDKAIESLIALDITLSGDDSTLENAWEEICVQVQGEESFFWETYEAVMGDAVLGELENLSNPDLAALWLQTDEGLEWHGEKAWEEEHSPRNKRASLDYESIPFALDEIVQHIVSSYLRPAAENFTNPNIECFLEEDPQDARKRRLIDCMPFDTHITDLWDWDIRFEDESFDDIEEAAFCTEDELPAYADSLAEDFKRWIDEYDLDYDQINYENPEKFAEWISEQCLQFMKQWRTNVLSEFGR